MPKREQARSQGSIITTLWPRISRRYRAAISANSPSFTSRATKEPICSKHRGRLAVKSLPLRVGATVSRCFCVFVVILYARSLLCSAMP